MATALYSGTYPCRHGNSKSGRVLRRGENGGGAAQRTRRRVFQNPGRSWRTATKSKEAKMLKYQRIHWLQVCGREKSRVTDSKSTCDLHHLLVTHLLTCYYALEHCCCAAHSRHCQDPYVTGFSCFQGGLGTGDCHGQHLLLVLAQQYPSPVLVGHGCAKPKEEKKAHNFCHYLMKDRCTL